MKTYTIELDETISEFFEDISIIAKRPIESILSDALFIQVEKIKTKIAKSFDIDEE